MAIHPTIPSESAPGTHLTSQQARSISAWTEQAAASLQNLNLSENLAVGESPEVIRGTSVPLTIPLDDPAPAKHEHPMARARVAKASGVDETSRLSPYQRRQPLRRDSLKRREALLKGKEGSRRRQRWENSRLLNNPWAQPPSASDWVVQPTHPRHDPVPYYLAPLWDAHFAHREQSRTTRSLRNADNNSERARISKEVRKRLKHARAARGLLQDLEEGVRRFIQSWNEKQQKLQNKDEQGPSSDDDVDSEDEVVFVGRNAEKRDRLPQRQLNGSSALGERDGEMMVFESPAHDRGGVFGRWLVHCIASYYGLYTWSVTLGSPARRAAYVGFHPPSVQGREGQISFPPDHTAKCRTGAAVNLKESLPKPLWAQL
ncbi:hypothetical protein VTN49DRAFT_118 [Thermomyces lanuginosus]|uniref:uncharacterized protein n=1 Tax=Thermomyces lanuginosus TaxID=5541 RepID=UPI00374206FB